MGRWSRLVFVVTVLALALSGIWYTNYVDRQSDKKWCELLTLIYTAQKDQPPSPDERVNAYRRQIAQLRHDLHCDSEST